MKQFVPPNQTGAKGEAAAHLGTRKPRSESALPGRLGRLAAMANRSSRVQAQLKLREDLQGSTKVQTQRRLAGEINRGTAAQLRNIAGDDEPEASPLPAALEQKAASLPNHTGLPDRLKTGVEQLSGVSLDNVRVHYNSGKPAQLNALAYAQGTDIHVAPGQEKHLPHEAWHVVQQAEGRVRATKQMKQGTPVNDDRALEREADVMGEKALQGKWSGANGDLAPGNSDHQVVQRRVVGKFGIEAEAGKGAFQISAPKDSDGANLIQDRDISFEEYKIADLDGHVSVTLDGERNEETATRYSRSYVVEYIQRPFDVVLENAEALNTVATAWQHALAFWQAHIGDASALKGQLGDWYTLQRTWRGGQFEGKQASPGVTAPQGEAPASFDWTNEAYTTGIVTATQDPEVSMQLTAGSTLLGLLEVYMETSAILETGEPAQDQTRAGIQETQRRALGNPRASKLTNFTFLLNQYVQGNANRNKRYAKEYVTLMSRTSLDVVYEQLGDLKGQFDILVADYLNGVENNALMRYFRRGPESRVFQQDATKEDVTDITIEQLLLSIIKKKRSEMGALEADEEAGNGDVLVQRGLAGFGEINPGAGEALAKFDVANAGEMMRGVPGMIFENRAAGPHTLSRVPDLFRKFAASLKSVNDAHDLAERQRAQAAPARAAPQTQPVRQAAPPPAVQQSKGGCYLTTACVTHRGLPDDCEELEVLRAFRDTVIARLPVGPELIACYYRQAPGIVAAIDAHADRTEIYEGIYEIVRFCVDAIQSGHDAIAMAAYCEMVMNLEQTFVESKADPLTDLCGTTRINHGSRVSRPS